MNGSVLDIDSLSPHLFWDVDKHSIKSDENKLFIVQRVLEYGLLSDWVQIYHHYGLDEIALAAMQIKDLDPKSLAFISTISKKPKEQFRCFTTNQLMPQHWNF
ncbi:MAG TPA: hypothetical protein VFC67_24795 [Prolixibacteraceae bacterium]|nr:hypothetical protein [Prolixibacteraceae bacterium]